MTENIFNSNNYIIIKINNEGNEIENTTMTDIPIEVIQEFLKDYMKMIENDLDEPVIDEGNMIMYLYPVIDCGYYFKILPY